LYPNTKQASKTLFMPSRAPFDHSYLDDEKKNNGINPLWLIAAGIMMMIGATLVWFSLYDLETVGYTLPVHTSVVWIYQCGGKWLPASILAIAGILLFGRGVRNLALKR
jgi:hypothetical protein